MPKAACRAFNGVVKPLGDARPAWKVLRVLGNLLGLPGFDFETSRGGARRSARRRRRRSPARLDNGVADAARRRRAPRRRGLRAHRRRADLRSRRDRAPRRRRCRRPPMRAPPRASACRRALLAELGLHAGAHGARHARATARSLLPARSTTRRWPPTCVRVPPAHADTAALGAMFGADHAWSRPEERMLDDRQPVRQLGPARRRRCGRWSGALVKIVALRAAADAAASPT